jgi:glycosyltransferase involved in cell wall biosynthesis
MQVPAAPSDAPTGGRELFAEAPEAIAADRTDRLLFALSQLPDDVTLRVAAGPAARARLERLARAYGIDDRVSFAPPGAGDGEPPAVEPAPGMTNAELLHELAPGAGAARLIRGDDSLLSGHRIALVTNRPAHFRVPLWNQLDARLRAAGAHLRVFSAAGQINDRPHMKLDAITFDNVWLRPRRRGPFDHPLDLELQLGRFRPTLVVSGGFSPAVTGRAVLFAKARRVPFGAWIGDLAHGDRAASAWRQPHRGAIARTADFGICYSSGSADYLHALAPHVPRVVARNTTPTSPRPHVPAGGDHVRILTVARALPGKRLDVIIDALERLGDARARLTIVGDGPALPDLRARAAGRADVELTGSVASNRIGELYAQADVFVFPSQIDVFGMVLVEALAQGVATVTSSYPGAASELVVDGVNGLVVDGTDVGDWAAALRRLIDDAALRARLGAEARRTVEYRWTIPHSVDATFAGLRLGALVAGRRPS